MPHGSKKGDLKQIKINVSRDPDNHELQLTIDPPLSTQNLFLNEQGQFDIEKIKHASQDGSLKIANPDSITLTIPGIEGVVTLRPDGGLIVENMHSESALALNTPGDVIINGPVHTKALVLLAKKIEINHTVVAEEKLTIQADECLQNNQTLESPCIQINGCGQFKNLGLISAAETLKLGIRAVDNYGTILANDVQARVKRTSDFPIYFNNEGILLGAKHLSLKIDGEITNQGSGEILSSGNVNIRTSSYFDNTAKIYAKGKLCVVGHHRLVNKGFLAAEQGVQLDSDSTIDNAGIVQSFQGMTVNSRKALYNREQGILIAETMLDVQSAREFRNAGEMEAKQSIIIGSNFPIINMVTGKILSNAVVKLQGLKKIKNEGEITGHLSVSTNSLGDALNGKYAKIGGEQLFLFTLGELYNKGDITAEEFLKLQAGSVHNKPEARLGSKGSAEISVKHAAINGGGVFARNLLVQAESLINQVRTGEITSLETLTFRIKQQLVNAHLIEAQGDMDITADELLNLDLALINGKKKVNVFARKVENHGKMVAGQLFLKVVERLCNSPTAQLAAKQCLELISRGSVENQGGIFSDGTILLEAAQRLANKLEGHIEAAQWAHLISSNQIENAATLIARGDLLIDALREFTNLAEGFVKGENVTIKSDVVRNHSIIEATQTLNIEAKLILDNLLHGLILAGEKLNLFSKSILENAGIISSQGPLILRADEILKNLNTGQVITDEDLRLLAGHVLSNAGHLLGNKDVLVKSGHWFTNLLSATVHAEGNLKVEVDYRVDNKGVMNAKGSLIFKALKVLRNHQSGELKAEAALSAIADIVDNWGLIDSEKTLTLESALILTNYQTGKLSSKEALQLYSAYIVRNAGSIKGSADIALEAETLLQTLAGSEIETETQLTLLSQFAIENAGLLSADRMRLEAMALLKNQLTGEVVATTALESHGQFTTNIGNLHSQGNLTHRGQALWNLSTGKMTAAEAVGIFLTGHCENKGLVGGKEVELETQSLVNEGTIASLKTLSLKVQETFKHCCEGKLEAREAIIVLAKDLQLVGQLMATGDFKATIERDFDYDPETLWACGLLKLMLKQGHDFTKPINTKGALEIETAPGKDIHVHTTLQSGQETTVTAHATKVHSGGLFAEGSLTTSGDVRLEKGTYLASNDKISLTKANVISNYMGHIYTRDDLVLEALSLIENLSGDITVGGKASITAPLFQHKLLTRTVYQKIISGGLLSHKKSTIPTSAEALGPKPTLTVSKDCTLHANTEILGGVVHVGGKLKPVGNYDARSFEAFTTWYETYITKGRRKGLFRGRREHHHSILRRQTTAIYDSQISSGTSIDARSPQFSNEGAFRAPQVNIEFTDFRNGNHYKPTTAVRTDTKVPLAPLFRESPLFGKVQDDFYVNGPKLPLRSNIPPLAPPVYLGPTNPVAKALFDPMIEMELVQRALHEKLRTGYIDADAPSPEAVLVKLRQTAFELSQGRALTEQDLALSKKAFIYYQQQLQGSQALPAPHLCIPQNVYDEVGLGRSSTAVVKGTDVTLKGSEGQHSTAINTGRVAADRHLVVNASEVENRQQTSTETKIITVNRRSGQRPEDEIHAVEHTGVMQGGQSSAIDCNLYTQIGGQLNSGPGGTRLIVRDRALIQALRTTEVHQGEISRKGRNYEIEPHFVPATMTSEGSQTVIVTNGSLVAIGMHSIAQGKNTIEAKQDGLIRNAQEAWELAFTRTHRRATGGSSFTSCASVVQGNGVDIRSQEGSVTMINTQLRSLGDVTVRAKKLVELLEDIGKTTAYSHTRKMSGFQYTSQKVDHSQTHVLRTEMAILGNLMIEAGEGIRLRAVRGAITGNVDLTTPEVTLEGGVEKETLTTKTKSVGLSFFGSQALENMMQGKNSSAVLKSLFRENSFIAALEQLAHAKEGSEKLIGAAQTFVEGWRLATLVAHACKEIAPDGTEGDVIGSLTDRWGLTTPLRDGNGKLTGRAFNPEFKLSVCKSEIIQEFTRTIPTTLMIGGDLHIVADIVKLLDGAKIEAQNISIHARRLLEIHAAENTQRTNMRQNGGSVSFHLNGSLKGVSVNGASHHSHSVQYSNAQLKARNLLNILVDGKMVLKGAECEARDVAIRVVEMIIESLQDTHDESGKSWGVSVGGDNQLTGIQAESHNAHKRWTNSPSHIRAVRTLEIFTDYLFQKGSILSAGERLLVQGLNQEKPHSWCYEDIQEVLSSRSTQIGLNFSGKNDSFPLTGFAKFKSANKTGVTRATVTALDLADDIPTGINRDLNRAQQVLSDKKSSIGIPVVVPNFNKLAEDTKTIGEALALLNKRIEPKLQPQVQMYIRIQAELERMGVSEEVQKAILSNQQFLQKLKPDVLDIPDETSGSPVPSKEEVKSARDWTPQTMFYKSKTHKVREITDKNGIVRKKDADDEKFSKSASSRVKDSLRRRPQAHIDKKIIDMGVDVKVKDMYELVPRVEIDPKTSFGITRYGFASASTGIRANCQEADIYASGKVQGGINLATAETQTEYYTSKVDIDGPGLQAYLKGNLEFNKSNIDISVEGGVMALAFALKENIEGKIEFSNFTLKIVVEAEALTGCGLSGQLGYKTYQKGGGSFYVGGRGVKGVGLGMRLRLDVEPKIQRVNHKFN